MRALNEIAGGEFRIGRFLVDRLLGEGHQGQVFLAKDPHLERQVAIKWLHPEAATGGGFPNEARMVARLDHPNVVPLFEAGVFRTSPYLVFAFVDGETLRERLKARGALPPAEAMALMRAVLDGVACAHAQGVLHLDLSPGNIIVDRAGVPRVMDFGQGRFAAEHRDPEAPGEVAVTPRYMSPEHLLGTALSSRSDVYALGLILYELLAGRPALPAGTLQALAAAFSKPILYLDLAQGAVFDAGLQAILRRALQRDPAARFADAVEMRQAVEDWIAAQARSVASSAVEFLLHRMQRKANFPALSNNLMELNRLTAETSTASVDALARIVMRDYAITNKLLKLANSSFYGRSPRGVRTVSDAIQLLGFRVIRMTCNSLVYLNAMRGGPVFLKDALVGSFLAALLGRHLAMRIGRHELAEEAFICGMFHRLGRNLAVFYFEEEYLEIERQMRREGLAEEKAAARILGIGYSELGVAVARRWKFPDAICESLRACDEGVLPAPATAIDAQRQVAALANELCELALRCAPQDAAAQFAALAERFAALVPLTPADLLGLLRAAHGKLAEFLPVLGVAAGGSRLVRQLGAFLAAAPVQLDIVLEAADAA